MPDYLARIVASKKRYVAAGRLSRPLLELQKQLDELPPTDDQRFSTRLREHQRRLGMAVIAECKSCSPSAGIIRTNYQPTEIALSYVRAGAAGLSVVVEEDYFHGKPEDLQSVARACDAPVLWKDFVFDEWQLCQARLMGADCVLLIAAMLPVEQLKNLHRLAQQYRLETLIEVHHQDELDAALACQPTVIGINNRNLNDLTVNIQTSINLRRLIPDHQLTVCESGISNAETLAHLRQSGLSVFLIGEHLMRQSQPGEALAQLLAATHRLDEL